MTASPDRAGLREARYFLDVSVAREQAFRYPTPEAEDMYGKDMMAGARAIAALLDEAEMTASPDRAGTCPCCGRSGYHAEAMMLAATGDSECPTCHKKMPYVYGVGHVHPATGDFKELQCDFKWCYDCSKELTNRNG